MRYYCIVRNLGVWKSEDLKDWNLKNLKVKHCVSNYYLALLENTYIVINMIAKILKGIKKKNKLRCCQQSWLKKVIENKKKKKTMIFFITIVDNKVIVRRLINEVN